MNITQHSIINFTQVLTPTQQKVSKSYFINQSGQLDKISHGSIYEGDFVHKQVAFKDLITTLLNTPVITVGSFTHKTQLDYVPFTTEAKLEYSPAHWVSRTHAHCAEFDGYSLFPIDQDVKQSFNDFSRDIYTKHPKLRDLAHIVVPSASSGVRRVEDDIVSEGGWHVMVIAKFNSMEERVKAGIDLFKRELIHTGHTVESSHTIASQRTLLIRSVGVDDSVSKDAARLMFNKPYDLADGVVKDDLGTIYREGGVLTVDTFTLSTDEEAQYKIKYDALMSERTAFRAKNKDVGIDYIAKTEGVTLKQATKLWEKSNTDNIPLSIKAIVKTRLGDFSIEDVIKNYDKFNGKKGINCNDFIEPNYNNGGNDLSKGNIKTWLKGDVVTVRYNRFTHSEVVLGIKHTIKQHIDVDSNGKVSIILPDQLNNLKTTKSAVLNMVDDIELIIDTKKTIEVNEVKVNEVKVNNVDLEDFMLDKVSINPDEFVLFNNGIGSGKTTGLINAVSRHEASIDTDLTVSQQQGLKRNVGVFTPYISLAIDFSHKSKYDLYLNSDLDMLNASDDIKYITTLDSAHKTQPALSRCGVVAFDELSMITERLAKGAIGKSAKASQLAFDLMIKTINQGGMTFAMDALYSQARALNLLRFSNKDLTIVNSPEPVKRNTKVIKIKYNHRMDAKVKEIALLPDSHSMIFVGSISKGNSLSKFFKDNNKKVGFFHRKLPQVVKEEMLKDWANGLYEVMITTQAIKTGVSLFTPAGKKGYVFLMDNTNNLSVYDRIQESNRLRDACEVYILCDFKDTVTKPTREDLLNAQLDTHRLAYKGKKDDALEALTLATVKHLNTMDAYSIWATEERYLIALENCVTDAEFDLLLKSQGYVDISNDEGVEDKVADRLIAKQVKEDAKQLRDDVIANTMDATIDLKGNPDELNEYQHLKLEAVKVFNTEDITPSMIYCVYDEGAQLKMAKMYQFLKNRGTSHKSIITKLFNRTLKGNPTQHLVYNFIDSIAKLEFEVDSDGKRTGGYAPVILDRTRLTEIAKTNDHYLKGFKSAGFDCCKAGKDIRGALQAIGVLLANVNLIVETDKNKVTTVRLHDLYNDAFKRKAVNVNAIATVEAFLAKNDTCAKLKARRAVITMPEVDTVPVVDLTTLFKGLDG